MAVGGQFSRDIVIREMVYQGAVLGPTLWNVFREEAAMAIRVHEFYEIVSADDIDTYTCFELITTNNVSFLDFEKCQHEVHSWCKANQVTFDASKESMHVPALTGGEGPNFRLLTIPFDHALSMRNAVAQLVNEASCKIASIL